jgi:hypothetical protein
MNDIQQGERRARKVAGILLALGMVIGIAMLVAAERLGPAVEAWLTGDPAQARARLTSSFVALAAAIALPVVAFAGYLWWLGARTVHAERFPPPGVRVVRDTVVVQGADARRWGRLAQVLAAVLTAAVVMLVVFLWRLLTLLGSPRT